MRVFLDACVLFPTVMREMLLGAAGAGAFVPLWSPRVLREWQHVAARLGPEAGQVAAAEIALLQRCWPDAACTPDPTVELALVLPDPNDVHVLAAAMAGRADVLMTLNRRDFPTRVLARHDLMRQDPDSFLRDLCDSHDIFNIAAQVQARAVAASGREQPLKTLLKRARLPALARRLAGNAQP